MHPALDALPCEVCKKFTHKDGVIERRRSGTPIERQGKPPCDTCPKVPKLAPGIVPGPEHAETLTPENRRLVAKLDRCAAVNWQGMADEARDEHVQHYAAMVKEVREQVKREQELRWMTLLMLTKGTGKKP